MTSQHVICGLGLPQSKILATPINWRRPEKLFLKIFFLENTCGCVLGPWPRAFLSLASRGSVSGKAVLGLGFFLCSWPWPRALCPRLHLCWWRPFFWFSPEFGKKTCSISGEDLFFFWSSLSLLTWKKYWSRFIPPMLKIGQNWDKIANYPPPMLNKDLHHRLTLLH